MRASVVGRGYDGPLYGGLPLGGRGYNWDVIC